MLCSEHKSSISGDIFYILMFVQTGKLHHTTTVPSLKNYANPKKAGM